MSIRSDLVARLRALFFRSSEEHELEEELRSHLEMEAEHQRRSGLSEEEARRRSHIALGGVDPVKEEVRDARGTRLVEDLVKDFGYTIRTLARSPSFAIVTILTLAIGIGGTTAVFSAVDAVLLQPLPYQEPGQLVRLYQPDVGSMGNRMFVTPVHFLAYRSQMSAFESAAAIRTYDEAGADIGTGTDVRRITTAAHQRGLFRRRASAAGGRSRIWAQGRVRQRIGVRGQDRRRPRSPRPATVAGAVRAAIPSAVGQQLTMNGKPYTVAGVMPTRIRGPDRRSGRRLGAAGPESRARTPGNATNHYLTVIARLRPTLSIERAQAGARRRQPDAGRAVFRAKDARARLYPLKEEIVGCFEPGARDHAGRRRPGADPGLRQHRQSVAGARLGAGP